MNMPITRLLHTCRRTLAPALLLSLAATAVHAQDAAGICRVTDAIGNSGDGSTWATPMTLDNAIAASACTAIWAKHGTYKPTVEMQAGDQRTKAFDISRPLKLYGGFAGTETTLAARVLNPSLPTILSGDLASDDAANLQGVDLRDHATRADNSYHVVVIGGLNLGNNTVAYTAANTVLDGLTITAGNANVSAYPHYFGGGLLCNGNNTADSDKTCSPTISNSTFSGNSASVYGGAIYNSSSPSISNSTFSGNSASFAGGAIYNNSSSPSISNSTFSGNSSSQHGGAIYSYNNSSPAISNSTFSGNSASVYGGAIYNSSSSPSISISNSTFSGNSASQEGGAIYNYNSSPTITASILWGNTAANGSPIDNDTGSSTDVNHSIVQDGWTGSGTGNSDQDPNLSALADHGGPTRTMLPAADGPAVTPGYLCTAVTSPPNTDQRGVARPTSGNSCHIGAVQLVLPVASLAVTTSGAGTGTVSSAPAGITACATHPSASGACTAIFGDGFSPSTSVTLTAMPNADSSLTGWSGSGASACSSASSTCTVVVDAAKTVEAQFGLVASDAQTPSGPVNVALSSAQCSFTSGPTYTAAPTSGVPAGYTALPYGQIGFGATGCNPGGALTITLTLPTSPAANAKLLKWDGSAWQPWAATLSGNTVTYNVTDNIGAGGAFTGDTNPTAGVIDDPVMLALFTASSTVAIPTLSEWGLLITSLLLAALAVAHHLRRQRRSTR